MITLMVALMITPTRTLRSGSRKIQMIVTPIMPSFKSYEIKSISFALPEKRKDKLLDEQRVNL